jgi:hypothetical protein
MDAFTWLTASAAHSCANTPISHDANPKLRVNLAAAPRSWGRRNVIAIPMHQAAANSERDPSRFSGKPASGKIFRRVRCQNAE